MSSRPRERGVACPRVFLPSFQPRPDQIFSIGQQRSGWKVLKGCCCLIPPQETWLLGLFLGSKCLPRPGDSWPRQIGGGGGVFLPPTESVSRERVRGIPEKM